MKRLLIGIIVVVMTMTVIPARAQDGVCSELVFDAYETTQNACDNTQRNQACYGNSTLTAQPAPNVTSFIFNAPGDIVPVTDVQSMRLNEMNQTTGDWGISLLRVQASITPDNLTDAVDLLLFGNVSINQQPTQTGSFGMMEAFTFISGENDRPCSQAPDSGILIQTPRGVGTVTLLINEVVVELGSTAYIQSVPNGEMVVNVVQGQGRVTFDGKTVTIPAGARSRITLDGTGLATSPPTDAEPYDATELTTLPISLLSQPISIAPAATNLPPASTGALQWYRTFDVYGCVYLGNNLFQWYRTQAPVNDFGVVTGEYQIVEGPLYGAYQVGCPVVAPQGSPAVWENQVPTATTQAPPPTVQTSPSPTDDFSQESPLGDFNPSFVPSPTPTGQTFPLDSFDSLN